MDSICGGGEHWAKPKEIQRKETVIDFHLYVGHREPIKYEILYVGSYSWKCTKYRVVSLTGQKETWYISAAPLLECYIAQSAMFPLWDTQLYKQLNWYLGLPFFSSITPVKSVSQHFLTSPTVLSIMGGLVQDPGERFENLVKDIESLEFFNRQS